MVVMYKMTPEKREKFTKKIDKMLDFLEEFKECLEDSDAEYRHEDYEDDEEYMRVPKSRYSRMMKRSKMG